MENDSDRQQGGPCPSILDGISDPIIVIDPDYNITYANKTVEDESEGETVGRKCYALLHGRKSPCTPCPCQDSFKTGKPYRIIRKEEATKQGHRLKEVRAYPIFDQTGQVIRVVEMIQDISQAETRRLPEQDPVLQEEKAASSFCGMIGGSKKMKALFQMIRLVAPSNATVLIYGESGTGKELVAQAIHKNSPRHNRPFVAIDCGALPETLLESELFGHVKGAFTGSIQNKKGLFEEAEGGTLFLDEIADTSLAFQSKLLRVLQEGEIRPVGGNRSIKVNVRVVAATNKPLKEAISGKTFREDLYYRLAVMPMVIPPLRERPDDILLLAGYFIRKYSRQNGKETRALSGDAARVLLKQPWRGNVRELENVMERAVLISPGSEIPSESLLIGEKDFLTNDAPSIPLSIVMQEAVSKVEREQILDAILKNNGNKSLAARSLGIARASLYKKLKQYQI